MQKICIVNLSVSMHFGYSFYFSLLPSTFSARVFVLEKTTSDYCNRSKLFSFRSAYIFVQYIMVYIYIES
jgi:hypothetical protein